MNYNIHIQHCEHFPIPDGRRSILRYGVEHHESTDQKADDNSQFGIRQFHAVCRLWNLYHHQQECKYCRTNSHDDLNDRIEIYTK